MVFEIIGARILAPYIGTSFFVWTSLIGFVLGSLSLGYYIGGKWIDKTTSINVAAYALLGSSIGILWVLTIHEPFLEWVIKYVKGLKASSIFAGIVLFVPTSIFLGMISPMMSKLLLKNLPDAGKTMGSIFAWGSIGSLLGTFLAGFYLLPNFYLTHIILSLQLITAVLAVIIFIFLRKWIGLIISILSMITAVYLTQNPEDSKYTYEYESEYNSIKVYKTFNNNGEKIRIMKLGMQRAGGMSLSDRPLPFNYLYYFRLAEQFNPDFQKTLMLGGAAYSFPQYFLNKYPDTKMDVIEIDPEVTRVAREYFGLKDHRNLNIFHQDARTYINTCQEKYDVIYSDTFRNAISLPYQLTTIEAVQKQYNLLNEGGLVLVNVIQSVEDKSSLFLQAELKTFMQVFPQVYLFADRGENQRKELQSTIILAIKSEEPPLFHSEDIAIDSLLSKRVVEPIPLTQDILTDDFAPVDYLAFRGL
jgi:predicted membrane-bound spermidine synthase